VPDEILAHISPGHSDNINFFGVINVDIEAELAILTGGWRPLRPAQLRQLGLLRAVADAPRRSMRTSLQQSTGL
jgi:hypothetical protein